MNLKYPILFVVSAVIGWILVCIIPMEYKTVVVYPTPDNLKKIQYKDAGDNCFEFSAKQTKCTDDATNIDVQ